MSEVLIRQTIKAEIERAKTAWNAVPGNAPLLVDYENFSEIVLADQVDPYLAVDIVFRDGFQKDMGASPILRDDGQIMVAACVKEGAGTMTAAALRDFIIPYLQLRDDLANGVRTSVAQKYPPKTVPGFYALPVAVGFWCDAVKPATP